MLITILLIVITIVEVYRVFALNSGNSKKSHYKNKLKGTTKMRWDLEFKVNKTEQIREEVRKEYDYMKSRIDTIEQSAKNEKDEAQKANILDKKIVAEKDAERLLNQIKALDVEINGTTPNEQYRDGVTGIVDQIATFRELEEMLRKYIKTL
jgi:hypothetical protein